MGAQWEDEAVRGHSVYPPNPPNPPGPPHLPGRVLGIDVGGSGTRVVLLENGTVR